MYTFHGIGGGFKVTDIKTAFAFSSDMGKIVREYFSAKLQLKQENNALVF